MNTFLAWYLESIFWVSYTAAAYLVLSTFVLYSLRGHRDKTGIERCVETICTYALYHLFWVVFSYLVPLAFTHAHIFMMEHGHPLFAFIPINVPALVSVLEVPFFAALLGMYWLAAILAAKESKAEKCKPT